MTPDERVLCVPRSAFNVLGPFPASGFSPDANRYMDALLRDDVASFRPRAEVEEDAAWLQIIPYVVCCHRGLILGYCRGESGGESRLASRWSIGIGGHIDDKADGFHFTHYGPAGAFASGMHREIEEEMGYVPEGDFRNLGVIFDLSNEVGTMHLGFVMTLDCYDPISMSSGTEYRVALPSYWVAQPLESWSRIVLSALTSQTGAPSHA